MAAAARLAKAGHAVELYEASDRLGGRWAPYPLAGAPAPVLADSAPNILGFPAPFRDLFRKSGRPFDVELHRQGYALVPAPPARHVFADGAELVLPTDRGEQFLVLRDQYGVAVAERWRDLLDRLDTVWQTVRPLGLEAELTGRSQLRGDVRRRLQPRRSIAQLAREMDHPHLGTILAAVAHRLGSPPDRTPAWCAVELSVTRRFGRWMIDGADPGRSSVLVDALADRLSQRRVVLHLESTVAAILVDRTGACGVSVAGQQSRASAVVSTVDPWQLYDRLLPRASADAERRGVHRLRPALAPAVTHTLQVQGANTVTETVRHQAPGRRGQGPLVEYTRPVGPQTLRTVHDHGIGVPEVDAGAAWDGFASWLRRPPTSSAVPGLFVAGPCSRAGAQPSPTVLSGALASYAAHDYLN